MKSVRILIVTRLTNFSLSQAAFLTGINGVHMQQMQLQCRKANDIVITPCYCKE